MTHFAQTRQMLREEWPTEHFLIRYNLRNPRFGRGAGSGGVRDIALVAAYAEALEKLYAVMTAPPWSRPKPLVGDSQKTMVYVFNTREVFEKFHQEEISAWTDVDLSGVPYICLPCRSKEQTIDSELHRAMAEAAHEATHVFNHSERRLRGDVNTGPWMWMHEAMAIYMEMLVVPNNHDVHRFLIDWIDLPELSLDAGNARYQAGLFISYLAEKFGPVFVNEVWTKSHGNETPFEAIERLLTPLNNRFCSSDSRHDVFASGYCMDSYFLWDSARSSYTGNIFSRYGERAISETILLARDEEQDMSDHLDHLACRYYQLYLEKGVKNLEVDVITRAAPDAAYRTPLKAEMAIVSKEKKQTALYRLEPEPSSNIGEGVRLRATISDIDRSNIDHIVLVVSNCGLRGKQENPYIEHDDALYYEIRATAY